MAAAGGGREGDRQILAHIAASTRRHVPLSGAYPLGKDVAIAEVRAAALGRTDLLSEHRGVYLGLSLTQTVDQLAAQLVGQAAIAARAGADMDAIGKWITVGFERGETLRASRRR